MADVAKSFCLVKSGRPVGPPSNILISFSFSFIFSLHPAQQYNNQTQKQTLLFSYLSESL
jgi:hypothetical protein